MRTDMCVFHQVMLFSSVSDFIVVSITNQRLTTDQDSLSFAKQDPVTLMRQQQTTAEGSGVLSITHKSQPDAERRDPCHVASGTRGICEPCDHVAM